MATLSLKNILDAFNAPLNEEQAWAVCYQCAKCLQNQWESDRSQCCRFNGVESVAVAKDGTVNVPNSSTVKAESEHELLQSLGVVVFQALDYSLSETEEQKLSPPLEFLLERMTGCESDEEDAGQKPEDDDGDEGIEDDSRDEVDTEKTNSEVVTIQEVVEVCAAHLQQHQDAAVHYRAVCRALVAEAYELLSFLDKISTDKEQLTVKDNASERERLEELKTADWARLWIQVMRQLRKGVHLKDSDEDRMAHSLEYALTPYEMLMEDIRSHRYKLNKVMVDGKIPPQTKHDAHAMILDFIRSRPPLHPILVDGEIPPQTKHDAHAIILEFIRSRPTLHPAKNRRLQAAPLKSPSLREQVLEEIRGEPRLKPTPGRVVESSRTKLDETDDTPAPSRKIIKPDMALLMSDSFEDDYDDDDDEEDVFDDKNRLTPCPLSPLTPLSPPHVSPKCTPWQQAVLDQIRYPVSHARPERRHSITVCETPPKFSASPGNKRSLQSSLECLSLTIDEVMHIRNVLTKAELECLLVNPELHELVSKGKVCFTCKKTKFSLFGSWSTRCKFCARCVCSKCVSKMRIPTEHFEHIPVYTLSPSPMSPGSAQELFTFEKTGSAPSSPVASRKVMMLTPSSHTDVCENNNSSPMTNGSVSPHGSVTGSTSSSAHSSPQVAAAGSLAGVAESKQRGRSRGRSRPSLQRSQTTARAPDSKALQGPQMNICRDCKAMVVNIIRASRSSLATPPEHGKVYSDCPSHKAARNFHLDLKPVYK